MLARDRFVTETPNVIDPGEGPPSHPSRPRHIHINLGEKSATKEGMENRDSSDRSQGLSLSRYGNSSIKHSLYTRNGNKGTLSKGVSIRCVLGLDGQNDGDSVDDDDDQDVIVFENTNTNAYERETPFQDEHTTLRDKWSLEKKSNNRFFINNEDDEDENSITQARLFAAAMLNESEKRQHSKQDLMSGSSDGKEPPSTLRKMMNRTSSFRNHRNDGNHTAAMAMVRASSFRTLNSNHSSQTLNRGSSHRHIPVDSISSSNSNSNSNSNKSTNKKHLDNIWLVDDTPEISKAGQGSSKTSLLRQKLVQASIVLLVGIIVVSVFALTAANSRSSFSTAGDPNISTAVAISSDPRLDKIVEFLVETTIISSVEDLYNSSSPQFRAARWLADEDSERLAVPTSGVDSIETGVATTNANVVSPFDFVQRYVLLVLYFALGGDAAVRGWTKSYNFASQDRHECSWYERVLQSHNNSNGMTIDRGEKDSAPRIIGIGCDRELRVRSITLPVNNLKGSIPSEIQYLSRLDSLDLKGNSLVGSIPEDLQNLVHLVHLDLSSNRLTGKISPIYWLDKRLTQLEFLDLSCNLLDLGGQNTSHGRRHSLGGEAHLKVLALGGNSNKNSGGCSANGNDESTISIPGEIRYLTNLKELSLDNSNIGGRIPAWLFHELKKLQFLDLSSNRLTGSITDVFPASGGSSPLEHLNSLLLHDNRLTGTLPESIGLMPDLTTVTIHHTNMTVGISAANLICWLGGESSALESLATDCGDTTCPCCVEDCCASKECYRDVDWHSGTSFSTHHQSENNEDEY